MPPIPPAAGLHPLVVHLPIGLLIVVPVFLLLALVLPRQRAPMATSALILMVLGTIAVYVAIQTGDMAEHGVELTKVQRHAVHEHEEFADKARLAFTVLTVVFAALVAAGRRIKASLVPLAHGLFLVGYLLGLTLLVNTAHRGGLVVHGYGVRAPVSGMPPDAAALPPETGGSGTRGDDDD